MMVLTNKPGDDPSNRRGAALGVQIGIRIRSNLYVDTTGIGLLPITICEGSLVWLNEQYLLKQMI